MNRRRLASASFAFAPCAVALVLAGCGDDTEGTGGSGGNGAGGATTSVTSSSSVGTSSVGSGGSGGGGAPPDCPDTAPDEPFTIVFHNETTGVIALPEGCGSVPYVELTLEDGSDASLHPEGAEGCGFTCDPIFAGEPPPSGCSDCGPGGSLSIEPGATAEYTWDRRAFTAATATAGCSGLDQDYACALGTAIAGASCEAHVQVCTDTGGAPGHCAADLVIDVTLDLTGNVADVIIVAP